MSGGFSPDDWIGRERIVEDVLDAARARSLAATLDRDGSELVDGAPLPPGWHWIYFHDPVPRSGLGPDGHEARGDFLPPIPLPRRMWAGGRIRFTGPLPLGTRVRRRSRIRSIEFKEGRSGRLAFVTVGHDVLDEGGRGIEEEQDIVYLESRPQPTGSRAESPVGRAADVPGTAAQWREPFRTDEVTLFRFSALTFNGHRIHYDAPYATEVEGYPGLVVHGPLIALLLLESGLRQACQRPGLLGGVEGGAGLTFTYRGHAPLFCGETFEVCGREVAVGREGAEGADHALELWAEHPDRGVAMRAEMAPLAD